jgi:hypothetical protein
VEQKSTVAATQATANIYLGMASSLMSTCSQCKFAAARNAEPP